MQRAKRASKSNHGRASAATAGIPGRLRRRVVPPAPPRWGRASAAAAGTGSLAVMKNVLYPLIHYMVKKAYTCGSI